MDMTFEVAAVAPPWTTTVLALGCDWPLDEESGRGVKEKKGEVWGFNFVDPDPKS
ncbi:hypothetical protein DsansV1_C12g0116301 [Dioscorea sansibarensis]